MKESIEILIYYQNERILISVINVKK